MDTRILSLEERELFYHNYLLKDFHKSEMKPLSLLESLIEQGNYLCIGFFEAEQPLGYAYLGKSNDGRSLILDYFAVVKEYRSKGWGGRFLEELKLYLGGNYDTLFAEVENPEFASDESDRSKRIRRIHFYHQNGFHTSSILACIFGNEYQILILPLAAKHHGEILLEKLRLLYKTLSGERFFEQYIHLRIVE